MSRTSIKYLRHPSRNSNFLIMYVKFHAWALHSERDLNFQKTKGVHQRETSGIVDIGFKPLYIISITFPV